MKDRCDKEKYRRSDVKAYKRRAEEKLTEG